MLAIACSSYIRVSMSLLSQHVFSMLVLTPVRPAFLFLYLFDCDFTSGLPLHPNPPIPSVAPLLHALCPG